MSTYVVAATAREAHMYMAERPGAWRYVSSRSDLRGIAGRVEFVWVPGWKDHPDAERIVAAVMAAKTSGRLEP